MVDSVAKKSRVLVNVIGIPTLLFVIIAGDDFYEVPLFSTFIFIIMNLSMHEFHKLIELDNKLIKIFDYFFISTICLLLYFNFTIVSLLVLMGVYVAFILIFELINHSNNILFNVKYLLLGFIWIGFFIGSMILIRQSLFGLNLTLMMFLSIWICDSFAFIFGSRYGKAKLSPSISPNKTWLGAISGFSGSLAILLIVFILLPINEKFLIYDYIVFGFIFGIIGQLGDLAESFLKRRANIKDTSNILQGHGGILDRFDSLSFASPVFFLYLYFRALL